MIFYTELMQGKPSNLLEMASVNSNYFILLKEYENNVIQHLSYNIVNNFFNHRADRR